MLSLSHTHKQDLENLFNEQFEHSRLIFLKESENCDDSGIN